jgi:hypothetical protein
MTHHKLYQEADYAGVKITDIMTSIFKVCIILEGAKWYQFYKMRKLKNFKATINRIKPAHLQAIFMMVF